MRKNGCFLFLTIGMLLTACGGQYKEIEVQSTVAETGSGMAKTSVDASTAAPETEASQAETPAFAASAGSSDAAIEDITEYQNLMSDAPVYYGSFRVTSLKGTAAVYAMSDEEINEKIGKTLSYGADTLVFGEAVIDVTPDAYDMESYPADRFSTDFKITASDLGITAKEVQAVSVLVEGNYFGNYFFVVDSDTLIVYHEGVFFEAKRI